MKFKLAGFALSALVAAASASVVDEPALRACRAVADDDERLACYDREMDRGNRAATEAAPAPAAQAQPPPPAPPEPRSAEERFGRERAIAAEERERAQQSERQLGELTALVEEIETRIDGLMTITLDNGQVWRQNRPDSTFRLKVGDPVRIQPGALKSYLMSGPSNRSTRVTRIK